MLSTLRDNVNLFDTFVFEMQGIKRDIKKITKQLYDLKSSCQQNFENFSMKTEDKTYEDASIFKDIKLAFDQLNQNIEEIYSIKQVHDDYI